MPTKSGKFVFSLLDLVEFFCFSIGLRGKDSSVNTFRIERPRSVNNDMGMEKNFVFKHISSSSCKIII